MDPTLKLPYARIPTSMVGKFSFLEPLALYHCGLVHVLVNSDKKMLAVWATRDALFIGKSTGEIARRVAFAAIRTVLSNADPSTRVQEARERALLSAEERKNLSGGREDFIIFFLSPQEPSDLVVVGEHCETLLRNLRQLWRATNAVKDDAVEMTDARTFANTAYNYRVPHSSRVGSPTIAGEKTKEDVERAARGSSGPVTVPTQAAGPSQSANVPTAVRDPPSSPRTRTVSFVEDPEAPAVHPADDCEGIEPRTGIPYAAVPEAYHPAFPQASPEYRDIAITMCLFGYCLTPRNHPVYGKAAGVSTSRAAKADGNISSFPQAKLLPSLLFLTPTHLHCFHEVGWRQPLRTSSPGPSRAD